MKTKSFIYRGHGITPSQGNISNSGTFTVETINCFGCKSTADAMRQIDRYLDGDNDPRRNRPTPSDIWEQIKGKAHLYQTAKYDSRYVKILKVVSPGTFSIQHPVFGEMHAGCDELIDYCL